MLFHLYEYDTEVLLSRALRPGDTYVDIGAQLGYTAALAAERIGPSGHMVLFEPDPRAYSRLEQSLLSGSKGQAPSHELIGAACSDKAGSLRFGVHKTLGWSYVVEPGDSEAGLELHDVPCVVTSEELGRRGISQARLLKIDVEGHEVEVLRGLAPMLKSQAFDFICIEKNALRLEACGYLPEHIHAQLSRYGYFGIRECDHQPIQIDSMSEPWLENYYYAASPALARLLVPEGPPPVFPESLPESLEKWYAESQSPDDPARFGRKLISNVRNGDLEKGVVEGEELLAQFPELTPFRGHLAHWYLAQGNKARARHHLALLVSAQPENHEARCLLDEMEKSETKLTRPDNDNSAK